MASETARRLRAEMTDAERKLWSLLRRSSLQGFRFRRQIPIGRYVADFACMSQHLIVELDGGQHAERVDYDEGRTTWLAGVGYRVLRFWNGRSSRTPMVWSRPFGWRCWTPHPDPPPQGGGRNRSGATGYLSALIDWRDLREGDGKRNRATF
jgi:very-short-patch-repair endonuclease